MLSRSAALPSAEETTPTKPVKLKLLLTPAEAAHALAIDRSTLYVLMMDGTIPSIKLGRARRIPLSWLEQWIADQIKDIA
jgi:excisionase family DNA binding protein